MTNDKSESRSILAEHLVGKIVRFNHHEDSGPWYRVVRIVEDLVEIDGLPGQFASHVFTEKEDVLRVLNEMFHVDHNGRIVKTSNNQPIPDHEPIFILRARDDIASHVIYEYVEQCRLRKVPADRITELDKILKKFWNYKAAHGTKVPGTTHGQ